MQLNATQQARLPTLLPATADAPPATPRATETLRPAELDWVWRNARDEMRPFVANHWLSRPEMVTPGGPRLYDEEPTVARNLTRDYLRHRSAQRHSGYPLVEPSVARKALQANAPMLVLLALTTGLCLRDAQKPDGAPWAFAGVVSGVALAMLWACALDREQGRRNRLDRATDQADLLFNDMLGVRA